MKFPIASSGDRASPPSGALARLRGPAAGLLALALAACQSLGASGPSTGAVRHAEGEGYSGSEITLVDLNGAALERLSAFGHSRSFAEVFGQGAPATSVIGNGDVIDVAIWEAPPAILFGATGMDPRLAANPVAQSASIPQQMVGDDGVISIPFVGSLQVGGRTTAEVEREIVRRLVGKAHQPQAIVRVVQNETRTVTVLGDVAASRRIALSARGERLLDALASAGGPRQPVGKTTVQIARAGTAAAMPLETVIREPAQNIRLKADDVVTVLFQPYSFIALGAVTNNAEIPFEGSGLTLAQALGRIGGLRDERADIRGVFIFRMEDPGAVDPAIAANATKTVDGRVPVIYRLNLGDASGLFAAQDFAIRDDDVLYVSNAPGADLQRFVQTLSSMAFSTIAIGNAVN
jgi:polysaccharide export outer membrane protein